MSTSQSQKCAISDCDIIVDSKWAGLSISLTGDLQGFLCTTVCRVYTESTRQKCVVDERGHWPDQQEGYSNSNLRLDWAQAPLNWTAEDQEIFSNFHVSSSDEHSVIEITVILLNTNKDWEKIRHRKKIIHVGWEEKDGHPEGALIKRVCGERE